jgi:hypothetical protein
MVFDLVKKLKIWVVSFLRSGNQFAVCRLCRSNKADKKNSHLVPKFLTKSVFAQVPHRATTELRNDGRLINLQDTPKEDHLLCENCEKRIEVVETQFAPVINQIHGFTSFSDKFIHVTEGQKEYLKCPEVHPTMFKLFVYSIIWRLSVSESDFAAKIKLLPRDEETIRGFLHDNLFNNRTDFLNNLDNPKGSVPVFHLCLIKPKIKTDPPGGILSAYSYHSGLHHLGLVDFILLIISDNEKLQPVLAEISNKQNEVVIVGLCDNQIWRDYNEDLVHQMRKR